MVTVHLQATKPSAFRSAAPAAALRPGSFAAGARPLTAFQHRSVQVKAVVDVDETSFEAEVLKADRPVLVDFWATWCGPCKLVAPSMVWADKEFSEQLKVVKINCTDSNKALMEQYKVYGLPCLIVFKDGTQVADSHREGAITKKDLAKYLETHVGVTAPAL